VAIILEHPTYDEREHVVCGYEGVVSVIINGILPWPALSSTTTTSSIATTPSIAVKMLPIVRFWELSLQF
jgi:hypothetical protein